MMRKDFLNPGRAVQVIKESARDGSILPTGIAPHFAKVSTNVFFFSDISHFHVQNCSTERLRSTGRHPRFSVYPSIPSMLIAAYRDSVYSFRNRRNRRVTFQCVFALFDVFPLLTVYCLKSSPCRFTPSCLVTS